MVVLRPGSSVLKPGVRERQRELETVITKYELLLAIGRTRNADFDSLDFPQLVYRLAECRLCLARLQRTAWQIDQSGQQPVQTRVSCEDEDATSADEAETIRTTLEDTLEKTRKLYQLPEVAMSNLAVQGEVQVLLEKGELLSFCKDHSNAMAAYAEAIRLCYNIKDEATEAILTSKLRKLQLRADAMGRVKSLLLERATDGDNDVENERNRLKTAFAKVAGTDGFLERNQLQSLALELNKTDALSSGEVNEIWRQVLSSEKSVKSVGGIAAPPVSKISFEMFWSWWVSDAVCNFMKNNDVL
ncbi:hypothetical protein V7S43_000967 [Phytophthora oleae]|uniref:Uncharacterized protein n=1 Tax=Phytophthora oleae TaxID=2107226 RepID=A0ABD3G3U2_9STRA